MTDDSADSADSADAAAGSTGTDVVRRADKQSHKLTRADHRQLKRELATGEVKRAALARKYGVTTGYITQFAHRYAREIDDIKADLTSAFAGLWIAQQEQRIAAYQEDYELASASDKADHHEWIKARTAILHSVADELGQIQGKQPVVGVVVQHVIVGVDIDDLT